MGTSARKSNHCWSHELIARTYLFRKNRSRLTQMIWPPRDAREDEFYVNVRLYVWYVHWGPKKAMMSGKRLTQGYASLVQNQVFQKIFSKPIDVQLLGKIRGPTSAFVLQTESFHYQECLANQEAPGSSSTFYSNLMEVALAWWKEE